MPNNRNRNRNRNRNKRNRNQNQNQNQNPSQNENNQQQAEGAEDREEQQDFQTQIAVAQSSFSVDDNGNSGSVSNGPTENCEEVTNTLEKTEKIEEISEQPATVIQQEADLEAEMGAKNSKHRKEKSDKQASNGKAEEQVRPPPTIIRRPPGSPRQAKVIVHRIVREEDKANGTAQSPEPPKVVTPKEQHLEVEALNEQLPNAHQEVETKQGQENEKGQKELPESSHLSEDAKQKLVEVENNRQVYDEVDYLSDETIEKNPKEAQHDPKEQEQYVLQLEKAMEFVENAHQQHVAAVQSYQIQRDTKPNAQQQEQNEVQHPQESTDAPPQPVAVPQVLKDTNKKEEQQEPILNNAQQQNGQIAPKSQKEFQIKVEFQAEDSRSQQPPPLKPTSKVIIHQIHLETTDEEKNSKPTFEEISSTTGSLAGTLSPPPRYLVESPKNVSSGQFARFSRDVQIQELELNSEFSSGEFNSLQSPLVCEVDSESEGSVAVGPERSPSDQQVPSSSRVEQQEQLRQKRAQKRNALESHFLPQLLNPRYLDSILEENEWRNSTASSGGSDQTGIRTPKLNETFPRSQLDFSRRHKRREEAPSPLKLETRLLEDSTDLESCTRLQSTLSPQSEDAELVYLSSSASSSVSDLMELELEQAAALAERALVDLDTDASRLIARPDDEMSSTSTTTADRSETEAETETETEREGEQSRESTPVNANPTLASSQSSLLSAPTPTPTPTPTPADREQLAKDTNVSGGSTISFGAASPLAATREEFVRNMDKVRELIEMTRREQEQGELPRSPSPPPVPPPPASVPPYSPESSSFHLASLQLKRQESNDSHCSDSTTHSQCTAINLASPPPPPTAQPPTPPLRQKPAPPPVPPPVSPPAPPTPQSEPELSVADSVANADADAGADTDTEAIKKLRLLCTEQLASMPYGEQVLEELASVAQNIADQSQSKMPYPMPQLPHIKELQLNANETKSTSAWLGLPTQSDPQVLVCLSPGQRDLVNTQTQPDDLLDAHQKFVERRGYHELSKAQVLEQDHQQQQSEMLKTAAMMRELRKSLSPTAPPVPPPPVPLKSAETAAKATAHENAKRDDASEQKQKITECESSSLENKPRRAADLGAQQSAEHRQSSSTTTSSHKATTETMSSDTAKFPTLDSMESELARMFPQHRGDIFEEQRKRFSNIEFPSHQPVSQTKRYSNIETSSFESKKRLENGQVVYDVSTSSHEKKEQGDPPKDQSAPPVPPPPIMSATKLNGNTFIDGGVAPKNSQSSRENGSGSGNGTYEEFRQRAKAAADAFGEQREQQNGLDQDRVFKDFDRLSQQMHAELQSTREKREKSASMYDLSGFTRPATGHPRLDELQQRRHAHMQELEREIERSAKSRQERMSSVPRQMEATPPRTHEIPIELEPRSRRAESLCNLNESPPRPHTTVGHYNHPGAQDDWSRYANDLGYSENIARPFAREVEICYQRQNQRTPHGIRAPRLSASTNDLSSSSQYSYDTFNAYGGRRTHAPMLNQAQQQQRPHYGSCYSMIERDPNPRYISTTSRRGVSPAPPPVASPQQQQVPPPAYDRQQRRSSLPRELHEQQLKYILSKEEELKFEVERLQQERRRLMEEMQRAPVLPAPQRRESYRPAAKLPTLSEDEVFRQQMAEEWMNKVAEREERRQHKIIRISKIEDEHDHSAVDKTTISDEFLDRVKERRHKLAMPADSDWESGAESQPQPAAQSQPESDVEAPPVRILEGQAEANLRQLPRHLREFAKFSTSEQLPDGAQMERHEEQERREEATDNAHSSATKKTSIVKTYKVSRLPPSVQARPSYKSNGYVSEPEPNYDSDYSTVRYRTQNPHRVQSVSSAVNVRNLTQDEKLYGTMPNPIKSAQSSYKNQPGRIENYTTGHSSVSEKEKKEWWDEVMDIFNGWLREHTRIPRIIIEFVDEFDGIGSLEQSKLSPLYTEGNLSRALAKESGYTSDSNLVFRKKEVPVSSPLSPVEQKQAYKSLQAGGEPPLLGFRKPAPEKPREILEEFEFIQITPTLTKIRVSTKELEEEVKPLRKAVTPPPAPPPPPPPPQSLTTKRDKKPAKMFSQLSKNLPSFIPLSKKQQVSQQDDPPPRPPHRKSSCTKSTVRVLSSASKSRHEQCFQPPSGTAPGVSTITLRKVATSSCSRREPICRSKSAGAVSTLLQTLTATKETRLTRRVQQPQQQSRLRSSSPSRRPARLLALRQSSRSPVAFGRSISKERSFAEEKKRLENTLPANRTNFEASTNILRDPSLKSPQEVREAVRSYATSRSKSLPRLRHTTVSTTTRQTMCFPQVRPQTLLDCGTRSLRKSSSKTGKGQEKNGSNDSLPRSNSTFSIDSMVRQEIVPIAPPKTYVGRSRGSLSKALVPLQSSRSEGHVPRKRQSGKVTTKPPPPVTVHSYSESVREKTNFWNDYNAKQAMSLPQEYKFCPEDVCDFESHTIQQPCIEDLVWKYEGKEQRPPKQVTVTDIARPQSPQLSQERRFSPTREVRVPQISREVRSPSRRRIDSLRSKDKEQSLARASSLSSADERKRATPAPSNGLYQCGELAHSATSLTHLERHSPSCRYRNNCERFTELNRFYSTLERVGQLERATSSSSFHPLRKDAEHLDFDEWRRVRLHERAEKELQYLVGKLQDDQKQRDLHFRSKDVDSIKWRQDADQSLVAKKKSVEDLRENFEQLNILRQQQQLQSEPVHRHWRRNTVADLACSLEHQASAEPDMERHLDNDLVSTLSKDQIKKITQQLNEIYSGNRQAPAVEEQYIVTVEKGSRPNGLKVRCNSTISKDQLLGPVKRKRDEQQSNQSLPRSTRSQSPVVVARETRGAIAAKNAELTLTKPPDVPPRPKPTPSQEVKTKPPPKAELKVETREPAEDISQKIQYFEDRQFDEPPKTIYHAREDSSPDEAEVMRLINQNMQERQRARQLHHHQELSNSLTDLSGVFGERPAARVNFHLHSPPDRPPDDTELISFGNGSPDHGDGSLELYSDSYYRSRSLSPQSQASACSSSYLQRVYTGEVRKMRQHFESIQQSGEQSREPSNERRDFFGLSSLRRARSDPEMSAGSKDAPDTVTDAVSKEDVPRLTHKFELRAATPSPERGRRRLRSAQDRLMPHIDIISKTAALKRELPIPVRSSPTRSVSSNSHCFERLRMRYESPEPQTQSYLSTSHPDMRDVHDISPHLSADWVAHKHPKPTKPEDLPKKLQRVVRASSTSPPRPARSHNHQLSSRLTSCMKDIFANQKFDPNKHRPKARYVPDGAENGNQKSKDSGTLERLKKTAVVTFKVSPNHYYATDVNIHFKTPIRHEQRQNLSEEELAIRQAEHMQKLYHEERRRKYLQELQDMNSRRHTDNFTPSQKSPIALNRYDDFPTDVTLKSLVGPKTVARALFNFQGQTSKELSFRKGDTIYIRRQIDANWYEGEHNAMIGLLPASYVEIVSRDGARTPSKRPSEGQARAKYNFQAQSGIELSLNKGELVTLTRRVDGNWFEGKIANRKGIFPCSYVEVLTDIGAEDIAAKTTTVITSQSTTNLRPNLDVLRTNINNEFNTLTQNGAQPPNGILKETRTLHKTDALHVDTSSEPLAYRALYKYRPQNSDELELLEGDVVHVLEKCDDGWFVGTSQRTGCFGTFPGNYVERA
ncbi:uncharacterized protein LOC6528893 isoform X8 [Drosophila yakuba]|uniref:uncharacterized protein LOC6528893 isoform X8 n=1 Tax=Drosophila yakuba TaxID=7245 RepID=UPI0019307965|nr:uncharacterized protein LOC6528893 isoform X8 [Drosophila yakuba]